MSIYKRGGIYWYKFQWHRKLVRESTKQGNNKIARSMESAHKTSLAKGEVGFRDKKPVPTLVEFCEKRFVPWIKTTTALKTSTDYYGSGIRAIKCCKSIAERPLDEISSEQFAEFAAFRQAQRSAGQHGKQFPASSP